MDRPAVQLRTLFLSEIKDVIGDAISTGRQQVYSHIISYLLRTINFDKNGVYNESPCELMTYMPATMDDRHRGHRAPRAAQQQLSIMDRETQDVEDATLEEAEHQSGLGGILNIPMEDSDTNDSDYHDLTAHDHGVAGVADKEVDAGIPPTAETSANLAIIQCLFSSRRSLHRYFLG